MDIRELSFTISLDLWEQILLLEPQGGILTHDSMCLSLNFYRISGSDCFSGAVLHCQGAVSIAEASLGPWWGEVIDSSSTPMPVTPVLWPSRAVWSCTREQWGLCVACSAFNTALHVFIRLYSIRVCIYVHCINLSSSSVWVSNGFALLINL